MTRRVVFVLLYFHEFSQFVLAHYNSRSKWICNWAFLWIQRRLNVLGLQNRRRYFFEERVAGVPKHHNLLQLFSWENSKVVLVLTWSKRRCMVVVQDFCYSVKPFRGLVYFINVSDDGILFQKYLCTAELHFQVCVLLLLDLSLVISFPKVSSCLISVFKLVLGEVPTFQLRTDKTRNIS